MKRISTGWVDQEHRATERPWQGQYSERAMHRLRIAATLLHRRNLSIHVLGDSFYPAVLQAVDDLCEHRRAWLRGLVDWVEAYDQEDSLRFARRKPECCDRAESVSASPSREDVRHAERFTPVVGRFDP